MNFCSHKNLHVNIYCGSINNNPKQEITQKLFNWSSNIQTVHPSERILFNKKKGHVIDDCKNLKVFQLNLKNQIRKTSLSMS